MMTIYKIYISGYKHTKNKNCYSSEEEEDVEWEDDYDERD